MRASRCWPVQDQRRLPGARTEVIPVFSTAISIRVSRTSAIARTSRLRDTLRSRARGEPRTLFCLVDADKPWGALTGFRIAGPPERRVRVEVAGRTHVVELTPSAPKRRNRGYGRRQSLVRRRCRLGSSGGNGLIWRQRVSAGNGAILSRCPELSLDRRDGGRYGYFRSAAARRRSHEDGTRASRSIRWNCRCVTRRSRAARCGRRAGRARRT